MRTTIVNFLTFEALNVIPAIYWILVGVYAALLLVTFWSIWSTGLTKAPARVFWSFLVLCLPLAGMYLYSFFCLARSDLSPLRQIGIVKRKSSA